jgi:hypothetical protein
VTPAGWGGVVFSGALGSYFNYGAMAHVNAQTSPLLVMSFFPLQSLFTPLLAAAALGSAELGLGELVGGATVAAGLLLCVAGQALDGGAPGSASTGKAAVDDSTEAATVVFTLGDLQLLQEAVHREGEASPGVLPILERAFLRSHVHWRAGGRQQQPQQQQQQPLAQEDTPFLRAPGTPPARQKPAMAMLARAKSLTALTRSAERVAVGLG